MRRKLFDSYHEFNCELNISAGVFIVWLTLWGVMSYVALLLFFTQEVDLKSILKFYVYYMTISVSIALLVIDIVWKVKFYDEMENKCDLYVCFMPFATIILGIYYAIGYRIELIKEKIGALDE